LHSNTEIVLKMPLNINQPTASKHRQTISSTQKVIETIGDLALEIMRILGAIGNCYGKTL